MRRGHRQKRLDEFLLIVLEHLPNTLHDQKWFSSDEVDEWAVEWLEDTTDKKFVWWFDGMPNKKRVAEIEKSLTYLVSQGLAEGNNRIAARNERQGYRKLNVLETLAKQIDADGSIQHWSHVEGLWLGAGYKATIEGHRLNAQGMRTYRIRFDKLPPHTGLLIHTVTEDELRELAPLDKLAEA